MRMRMNMKKGEVIRRKLLRGKNKNEKQKG